MALDKHIKAVGFDMDGTVMRTRVDYVKLTKAVTEEFLACGMPNEFLESQPYLLDLEYGYRWLDEHGMTQQKEKVKKRISEKSSVIEVEFEQEAKPFPGALDVVRKIHSMGFKTGILTRGGRRYATLILERFDLLKEFDGLVTRDDYDEETDSKPAGIALTHLGEALGGIDAKDIIYIGDSLTDFMTAARAGSQFVALCSGHTDESTWRNDVREYLQREPHQGYSQENLIVMNTIQDLNKIL